MSKTEKIAKGYRLSQTTHNKISKIRKLMNSDSEKALSSACNLLLKYLQTLNTKANRNGK
jgi:hypothetical protein